MIVLRLSLTALLVIGAVFAGNYVWTTYFNDPWTRDARVHADVVQVASYVSGEVVDRPVVNNMQVRKGDVLMRIDPRTYEAAVKRAESQVDVSKARLAVENDNSGRLTTLQGRDAGAVAEARVAQSQLQRQSAQAALQSAEAELLTARINLERAVIRSKVDGYVTNLAAEVGDFAQPGASVMAIVDQKSFRVDAFFMETSIARVAEGDRARIRLMASSRVLHGRVRSVARAISDTQNATVSGTLLQAPQPSFEWIRLAQRIPVEIELVDPDPDVRLVSGATATVIVESGSASRNTPPAGEADPERK